MNAVLNPIEKSGIKKILRNIIQKFMITGLGKRRR